MKQARKAKDYWEMTGDELREATKEFDREFVADTFKAPGAQARAQLRRARGRPKIGEGCAPILVSMDAGTLRALDAYAQTHKTSRSRAISQAVQKLVARRKAS